MIDTHCHLDLLKEEDFRQSIQDPNLEYLITVGYDRKTIQNAIKLSQEYSHVYCAIGFHPHEADNVSDEDLQWLKEMAKQNKKVVALGEMGLDYYKNYSQKEKQQEVFRKQIRLAIGLGLPIVVHSRDAEEDTIKILEEEKAYEVGGVMHCFTGSYQFMRRCVELGFYISYSGIITYKNADSLREVAKRTPTTRLLIETDSPFLAPQPVRGKPNKPSNLVYIAQALAQIIPNSSFEDIKRVTTPNAKLLFNLGNIEKKESITYVINNKLYINLTNKCNLHCVFCQRERERNFWVKGYWVWTSRDPSVEDVIREIGDPKRYDEVVFCGYGEPTLSFEKLKQIAKYVKENGGKVRVDTNGLMFTFLPKEKLKELKGLVDVWSVSLNAQDEETYNKICKPVQPNAYQKVIEFIKTAVEEGFEVIATAVEFDGVDMEKTKEIALSLGAKWRGRIYESVG